MSTIHDETSSVVSFEDVVGDTRDGAGNSGLDGEADNEEAPDVLYVLQYSHYGRIVDVKKSKQPLDDASEQVSAYKDGKSPIIEVLSTVRAGSALGPQYQSRRSPPYRQAVIDYDDGYESEHDRGRGHRPSSLNPKKIRIVIHSPLLKNALRAVVGFYPGVDFMAERVVIRAPYEVLLHHRVALTLFKYAQPACHSPEQVAETSRHIDVLLGYLDGAVGSRLLEEEQRYQREQPCATFDWLWHLYPPGEVIYAKRNNIWTPFVVSRVEYDGSYSHGKYALAVDCWSLGFVDGRVRRNMSTFFIDAFTGEQAVGSLPVIPAALFSRALPGEVPKGESMEEKQVRLGKLYWELVKSPNYKEYNGEIADSQGLRGKLSGRVVVDAEGFYRYRDEGPPGMRYHQGFIMPPPPPPAVGGRVNGRFANPNIQPVGVDPLPSFQPRCGCAECEKQAASNPGKPSRFANFDDLDPITDQPPTSNLYFLALEKEIPAFILGERRWGHVRVEHLKDVKADREAFKYLVLDDDVKHTVKSLIGKFASADGALSPWPRDLIKNKGEGRIFLLHGSPGVGKTATCEAAAELAQRPLLCLTSGDLGSDHHDTVERYLNHYLHLGERYGALVLLDEADVYLERRRPRDLHRNGLVSIFLRALEYFRGVLFLTTNRVSAFDNAFTSRIHVALHYRRLDDADRARVWDNSFDRLERDAAGRVHVSLAARDFARTADDVLELRLNGRQIKNALQVAVALAESEAAADGDDGVVGSGGDPAHAPGRVVVSDRHLRAVVKMNRGFRDFTSGRRWAEDSDDDDDDDVSARGHDDAGEFSEEVDD